MLNLQCYFKNDDRIALIVNDFHWEFPLIDLVQSNKNTTYFYSIWTSSKLEMFSFWTHFGLELSIYKINECKIACPAKILCEGMLPICGWSTMIVRAN